MKPETIKALHAAALQAATELLADATDEQARAIDAAVRGGAILTLELAALPDPNVIHLHLLEREGTRQRIVSQSWQRAPLN